MTRHNARHISMRNYIVQKTKTTCARTEKSLRQKIRRANFTSPEVFATTSCAPICCYPTRTAHLPSFFPLLYHSSLPLHHPDLCRLLYRHGPVTSQSDDVTSCEVTWSVIPRRTHSLRFTLCDALTSAGRRDGMGSMLRTHVHSRHVHLLQVASIYVRSLVTSSHLRPGHATSLGVTPRHLVIWRTTSEYVMLSELPPRCVMLMFFFVRHLVTKPNVHLLLFCSCIPRSHPNLVYCMHKLTTW